MMQSIWESETFYKNREIIIIGSGFTGLWTAVAIKEKFPEKSVLIVEKNPIPIGASGRNAGFACFGSLTEILADSNNMGWEKTLDLVRMRFEGLQKIKTYFDPKAIDFNPCGGYEIINDKSILHKIEEVNSYLKNTIHCKKTFTLENQKIKEFGLENANFLVENTFEGALHPGKLLQELLAKCHHLGVDFLFGTKVLEILETDESVTILTHFATIKTEKIVICTNAFTKNLLPEIDVIPARGQILLTTPIENLKLKGTFHYDQGFYYFRNLGNKILLGGARNKDFETEQTTEFATTEVLQRHLEDFLKKVILPNENFEIEQRWSGIMAFGKEKAPLLEKISERQIVAVRLSGMGVALAPKIGEMVAEIL